MTKSGPLRRLFPLASIALVGSALACGGGGGEHGAEHGPAGFESHMGRVPLTPPKAAALDVEAVRKEALKHFGVLPAEFPNPENPITDAKINLGRMLYYEGRLSQSGEISCNSCHLLDSYGMDSNPTSPGHQGALGDRNSPTVYNAAGHLAQFWDGRAPTVEEQAKGPILNPVEMAMADEASVVAVLKGIPGYVEAFTAAFPGEEDAVTYDNMAKAIGAFERKLTTPAAIDAWLAGDDAALSHEAVAGLQLFLELGCQTCHNGYNFGGQSYQKLGTEKPWPGLTDVGRFKITNDERDRFAFKVPTLRNIDKTGPYLHDGSIDSLATMVDKMAEHQTKRGAALSAEEQASMMAFLGSLTGELPSEYIAEPELPADGDAAEPTDEAPADAPGDDAADKPAKPAKPDDDAADKPAKPAKPAKPVEDKPADGGE